MERLPRYTRDELTIVYSDTEFGREARITVPGRDLGWHFDNKPRHFKLNTTEKIEKPRGKPMTLVNEYDPGRPDTLGAWHGSLPGVDIDGAEIDVFVEYLNELLTEREVQIALEGIQSPPTDEDSYDYGVRRAITAFEEAFSVGPRDWREAWQAVKDYVEAMDMVIRQFDEPTRHYSCVDTLCGDPEPHTHL